MTLAAPTPNENASLTTWMWQQAYATAAVTYQIGGHTVTVARFVIPIYLAATPAQFALAVGRGVTPLVNRIPAYGPQIAYGLDWGIYIGAAIVDPVGFGISEGVREGSKRGLSYLNKNDILPLSEENQAMLTGAIVMGTNAFVTPYAKTGIDAASKWAAPHVNAGIENLANQAQQFSTQLADSVSTSIASNPALKIAFSQFTEQLAPALPALQSLRDLGVQGINQYVAFTGQVNTLFQDAHKSFETHYIRPVSDKISTHPAAPKAMAAAAYVLTNEAALHGAAAVAGVAYGAAHAYGEICVASYLRLLPAPIPRDRHVPPEPHELTIQAAINGAFPPPKARSPSP